MVGARSGPPHISIPRPGQFTVGWADTIGEKFFPSVVGLSIPQLDGLGFIVSVINTFMGRGLSFSAFSVAVSFDFLFFCSRQVFWMGFE